MSRSSWSWPISACCVRRCSSLVEYRHGLPRHALPVTLTGRLVELRPLDRSHIEGLIEAVQEDDLWKTAWYTSVPAPDGVAAEVERRIGLIEKGEMVPFTAFDASGRILGLTSYYDIVADVPRLHIGFTWNRPSAHGTGTNAESKLLLLRHAFETLGVFRVGLTTQWVNFQSRAAIERLGAKQDGVMRAMSRYRNGALRDGVEYSIIEPGGPQSGRTSKRGSPDDGERSDAPRRDVQTAMSHSAALPDQLFDRRVAVPPWRRRKAMASVTRRSPRRMRSPGTRAARTRCPSAGSLR